MKCLQGVFLPHLIEAKSQLRNRRSSLASLPTSSFPPPSSSPPSTYIDLHCASSSQFWLYFGDIWRPLFKPASSHTNVLVVLPHHGRESCVPLLALLTHIGHLDSEALFWELSLFKFEPQLKLKSLIQLV